MKLGRISKHGNAWAIVIPADIRRELQWWPGDDVLVEAHEGKVLVTNHTQHNVELVKKGNYDGNGDPRRT